MELVGPLRRPREYFGRYDRPSLAIAVPVVCKALLVSAIVGWYVHRIVMRVGIEPWQSLSVGGWILHRAAGVFLAVIGIWIGFAAIVHVLVWLLDGRQGFGTTLAVTGESERAVFALLPMVVVGLLTASGNLPTDPDVAGDLIRSPVLFYSPIARAGLLVGFLWRAAIQGVGLAEVHDLPTWKTVPVALLPGVLAFVLRLP